MKEKLLNNAILNVDVDILDALCIYDFSMPNEQTVLGTLKNSVCVVLTIEEWFGKKDY